MLDVTLRYVISEADREPLRNITLSSGYFSPEEVDTAMEVFDDTLSQSQPGYQYVLAQIVNELAGYACWGKDELTESSYELYWIAVSQQHRSLGIGKKLLHAVEVAIANECSTEAQLFIETAGREQYLPTRLFYERQGYLQAALLDNYYSPGDDLVIYSKLLHH